MLTPKASSSQPPTLSRPLALAFFGMLPRWEQAPRSELCEKPGIDVLTHLVLPALRDRVLRTALRSRNDRTTASSGFDAVHVYAHTFDTANSSSGCGPSLHTNILAALREAFASMANEVTVQALTITSHTSALVHPHMQALRRRFNTAPEVYMRRHTALFSMERAVDLLKESGGTPVILLRWDTVFFAPAAFHKLNFALLYRANWCTAVNIRSPGAAESCVVMRSFTSHDCAIAPTSLASAADGDTPGVPDYWFAGNANLMRLFVGGGGFPSV